MCYKVAVIMSTYNGELFLAEQINSILNQKDVDLTLYIRDDGSNDKTVTILDSFKAENVIVTNGNNVGVGNSFMQELYSVDKHYDYYAFSDQDDIWLDNKIISAINKIESFTVPALYCSNQFLVDQQGSIFANRFDTPINTDYIRILCNNDVTGCTMLWNDLLNNLIVDSDRRPSSLLLHKRMHDVWVAMVAAVTGCIVYDTNSYILYRQHDNNVVGVKHRSIVRNWFYKTIDPSLRNGRSDLAREILNCFEDKIEDKTIIDLLTNISNYRNSIAVKRKVIKYTCIPDNSNENRLMYIFKTILNLL